MHFAFVAAFLFYLWLCVVSHFQVLREVDKLGLLDGCSNDVRPFGAGAGFGAGAAGVGVAGGAAVVGGAALYGDDPNTELEEDEDEEDEDKDEEEVQDEEEEDEEDEDMEYTPEGAKTAMEDVEQHT